MLFLKYMNTNIITKIIWRIKGNICRTASTEYLKFLMEVPNFITQGRGRIFYRSLHLSGDNIMGPNLMFLRGDTCKQTPWRLYWSTKQILGCELDISVGMNIFLKSSLCEKLFHMNKVSFKVGNYLTDSAGS